jgi:hypothetical protein
MKRERIATLLEKYWQAETTVEEEKILAEYFRGPDVPPEWESHREIFSFFSQEAQVKPGAYLEEKIMQHIRPRRHMAWWAAAAVIIGLLALIPLLQPEKPRVGQRSFAVADTYDDPQQALAAVQKALFTVSKKMNKGLHPLK